MKFLTGYAKPVVAVASNRDGSCLFSAADGHSMVWEWDVPTGTVARKHKDAGVGRYGPVFALAASPAGNAFASAAERGLVGVWPAEGSPFVVPDGENVGLTPSLVYHPGGRFLAATISRHRFPSPVEFGFQILDVTGDSPSRFYAVASQPVSALAFSPDGSRLACASRDGNVTVCDFATGEVVHTIRTKSKPSKLSWRDHLAVACGNVVAVYDAFAAIAEFRDHGVVVRAMAHSPDGKYLVTAAGDGVVALRDAMTHDLAGKRHLDIGELACLSWAFDSSQVFVGGNKVIAVLEPADLAGASKARPKSLEPLSLAGHAKKVTQIAYSADGGTLVTAEEDRTIVWDMSGGAGQAKKRCEIARPQAARIASVSVTADGGRVAVSAGGEGYVYGGQTGSLLQTIDLPERWSQWVAFTPAGLFVHRSGTGYSRFEMRSVEGHEVLAEIPYEWVLGASPFVPLVATPDRKAVLFVLQESICFRWEVEAGALKEVVRQNSAFAGLALSPDGRRFATGSAKAAIVRDVVTGEEVLKLKHPLNVTGVGYAPDGRLLTACNDGVVRVWDERGGAELYAFELGMGRVYSLAVSPDGMTFAAGVHKRKAVVLMDVPD